MVSMYTLTDPLMNVDLGEAQINRMFPSPYIPGVTGCMNGITMNGVGLTSDVYQGAKSGKNHIIKTALGLLGVTTACILLKKGKDGVCNVCSDIKKWFKG